MTRNELRDFAVWIGATDRVVYGERIAVVRDEEPEKIGRIIMPDSGKPKRCTGTVVALGLLITADHKQLAGMQVGDKVMFTSHYSQEMMWPDKSGVNRKVELFHAADIYTGYRPRDSLFKAEDLATKVEAAKDDPETETIRRDQEKGIWSDNT